MDPENCRNDKSTEARNLRKFGLTETRITRVGVC